MAAKVGQVGKRRYGQLVTEGRKLVEQQTRCQFKLGDMALEIEPLRALGGAHAGPGEELLSVSEALCLYAEDIGVSSNTLKKYRWVAARWPAQCRRRGVSHYIHSILAGISDESERFATLADPPRDERSGERRWTADAAKRVVGWQVDTPESVQEKVDRIHDLADDEQVASTVTTDFLRRPVVAWEAMNDRTARHAVNHAQVERSQQAADPVHRQVPALEHVQHSTQFVDLMGACASFVSTVGRVLPDMAGHRFTAKEQAAVGKHIARVRATADWIESAVDTGNVGIDEGLAQLLRGE